LDEADRGTENTSRFKMKLRAHFHFIVKQQRQRSTPVYSVPAIRAVLTASTTSQWAQNLRESARRPIISPDLSDIVIVGDPLTEINKRLRMVSVDSQEHTVASAP
jgi:hypothetical protein